MRPIDVTRLRRAEVFAIPLGRRRRWWES